MTITCNTSEYAEHSRRFLEKLANYTNYKYTCNTLQDKQENNIFYWNKILNNKRGYKKKWKKFITKLSLDKKIAEDMSIPHIPPVLDVVSSLNNDVAIEMNCSGKIFYLNALEIYKQLIIAKCITTKKTKKVKKGKGSSNSLVIFNPITQYPFTNDEITSILKKLKSVNTPKIKKVLNTGLDVSKFFLNLFGYKTYVDTIFYLQRTNNIKKFAYIYSRINKINIRDLYSFIGNTANVVPKLLSKTGLILKGYSAIKYFLTKEKKNEQFSLILAKQIYLTQLSRTLVGKYTYENDVEKILSIKC